ncbi:MAG: T9SS type A sorting domain-containing protein [Bacteroidaceae bacterium]|nr:T9SS type A sorting domain-containing protein [Bacteroidaceae bacterium]
MKSIRLTLFALASGIALSLVPQVAHATPEQPATMAAPEPQPTEEVTMTVANGRVRVQNAEGATLDIYNITGVKVQTHRIDSNDKSIQLNLDRGIYIFKVGKMARRVNVA